MVIKLSGGRQGEAVVNLSRPWYQADAKMKKGALIALIRMHRGHRVAHLYKLVAPVRKSEEQEWRCSYVNSNVLADY